MTHRLRSPVELNIIVLDFILDSLRTSSPFLKKPNFELVQGYFSQELILLTLFDVLLPNDLRLIAVLLRNIGPCLQKITLYASGVRTNLVLAMENNVETYFTILRAKKHIIEF